MYKELLDENYADFTQLYKNNILKGFRELEKIRSPGAYYHCRNPCISA